MPGADLFGVEARLELTARLPELTEHLLLERIQLDGGVGPYCCGPIPLTHAAGAQRCEDFVEMRDGARNVSLEVPRPPSEVLRVSIPLVRFGGRIRANGLAG